MNDNVQGILMFEQVSVRHVGEITIPMSAEFKSHFYQTVLNEYSIEESEYINGIGLYRYKD